MRVWEQQVVHACNLFDGRSMQLVIFVLFVRRRCMPQSYFVVNTFSVKTVYQSGETCFAVFLCTDLPNDMKFSFTFRLNQQIPCALHGISIKCEKSN